MPALDLSITIITYNEERDLPRCLASLPRGAEVIVVDSHSSDDTLAQQSYRQRRKVSPLHVLRPPAMFFYLYVIRGGFLDGYVGYCLALYASLYSFVKYAKLNDLYRQATSPPAEKPARR